MKEYSNNLLIQFTILLIDIYIYLFIFINLNILNTVAKIGDGYLQMYRKKKYIQKKEKLRKLFTHYILLTYEIFLNINKLLSAPDYPEASVQ